ncbi:MAG: phage terminase large subunit family protein [Sulfuricurvum sp.]|nr:phage terminase large subunit family protein [Sulfuricurvum sp.]
MRTFNLTVIAPPKRLSVSQWADEYRYLSPEASAEPGKWNTSRAEYQRGMMDAFSDPSIHTVVIMSSAQIGKTEMLNNIVGFFIDQDPSPVLLLQPTLDMGEAWSKDRLAPMLRDTLVLKGKVGEARTRDSGNTLLHKQFQGGHITIAGANSPASLASRPIRVVLCDEVDRYPIGGAGSEGDSVALAFKRTTTFWNRKMMITSTPTIKGVSRVEMAYEGSDMRRYHVPCPECHEEQHLKWANVTWEKDDPSSARYTCDGCGSLWSDAKRWGAIKKGQWIAQSATKGVAGFHLNEIYSPWVSLCDMVTNFLEAKKSKETLKTFVNTSLGETWEEEGIQLDDSELMTRREEYTDVPSGALVLVAGVDVQDDRLELEVKGFGNGEESWGIDYKIIYGDPSKQNVWDDLDTALLQQYQNEDGYTMRIAASCIDTGGHFADAVYKFVKNKEARRVYAVKGSSTPGAPLVNRGTRSNKGNVKLFSVGTDTAKELIFARLKIDVFGSGYMHFSKIYDEEFFKQLTAERITTKFIRGFPARVWTKTRPRNEALDLNVYALAALAILNPNWSALKANLERKVMVKEEQKEMEMPQSIRQKPRKTIPSRQRGGFASAWK